MPHAAKHTFKETTILVTNHVNLYLAVELKVGAFHGEKYSIYNPHPSVVFGIQCKSAEHVYRHAKVVRSRDAMRATVIQNALTETTCKS